VRAGFARDDRNSCEFRYDGRPNLVAEFARIPTHGQRTFPPPTREALRDATELRPTLGRRSRAVRAGFARDDRNSCEFRYDDRPNLVAEFARIPTRGQRISPNQQEKRRGTRPNYGQRWATASSCAGWVRARRSELLRVPLRRPSQPCSGIRKNSDSRPTNFSPHLQEKRRGTRPNYGQRSATAPSCAGWVRARRSELLRVPLRRPSHTL
jgi:hypothetical protein